MKKICPSPYKIWARNQNKINEANKNSDIENNVNNGDFFTHISKYHNISNNSNTIFVVIKLPTNVFIYEWFQENTSFKILKDFVVSMDISHEFSDEKNKNFFFVDLIYEKYEFSDDQNIQVVFQKEKEAIENNEIPNSNIVPSDRIFLKVKMIQSFMKINYPKKKT